MTWNTPKPGEWKSEELSKGRIIDYKAFNFVDGEGVRNSLYVSGCMFHCEGCYNVATWSFNAGIPGFSKQEVRPSIHTQMKVEPTNNTAILTDYVLKLFHNKYTSGAVRSVGVNSFGKLLGIVIQMITKKTFQIPKRLFDLLS